MFYTRVIANEGDSGTEGSFRKYQVHPSTYAGILHGATTRNMGTNVYNFQVV